MSGTERKVKCIFSVTNCICFDQRVQKMAGVLQELGCDVTIAGRRKGECCDKALVPFRTRRFRMFFNKGFLFYKFYNIRLFVYLLFHRFDLLVANDLDTLLPNYLVSKIKGLPLVYDSHEYFTGVPELNGRTVVKWIWKLIERTVFPRLDYVITVSESIADLYWKEYRVRTVVIRNMSPYSGGILPFNRKDISIREDNLLLILQGNGINIDKGAEELIDAIGSVDNVSLIIAGSGDVVPSLKKMVADEALSERVKFIPSVPWKELMRYTRTADAGVLFEKDTNINYRYSLPNKLFDYISAGLAVVTGHLPEIERITGPSGMALSIPEISVSEIIKAILILRDNRLLLNKLRQNSVKASESLNWESESETVKELYLRVLKKHGL